MSRPAWHVVTCEYPPAGGGVADYTKLVAAGLVGRGEQVTVWAPGSAGRAVEAGVTVERVAGRFGPWGLWRLETGLNQEPPPRRVWVQYVPHGFGAKGMNVLVAGWLLWRRLGKRDAVWVLFHEVAYPWVRRPLRHNLIAAVNRVMAVGAALAAGRVFVSVPAWAGLLRRLGVVKPAEVLPVPANVPTDPDPADVAKVRAAFGRPGRFLVGHFGTFGPLVTDLLGPALDALLTARPGADVLLIGAGEAWRAGWVAGRPAFADRVRVTGRLDGGRVAAHLAACDVAVQPFADGASGRRTSLMAGVAAGVAVVTTSGPATESEWHAGAVRLAPVGDAAALAARVVELLDAPADRARVGAAGRAVYDARFSLPRLLDALLAAGRP